MDINVYLPDELGKRAKDADIKFSALLREAVTDALDRQAALEHARDGMTEQTVDIDADEPVRLRFVGKHAYSGDGLDAYLIDDGRVLVVFERDYQTFDDVEEFSGWAGDDTRMSFGRAVESALREAVGALGGRVTIDL